MVEVDKTNYDDVVLANEKPVLVDFWGPGCGKCFQMMPQIEELEKTFSGKVVFAKMNIQGNRRLAIREQVMGLPTVIIYRGGEKIDTFSCDFSVEEIEEALEEIEKKGNAGE